MLAEYTPETRSITLRGEAAFTVRGLNLEDITFLAETYLVDIKKAVAIFGRQQGGLIPRNKIGDLLLLLAKDFPALAAEIISRAADEPGQVAKARQLPFMTQITALQAVMELSTEEAGGLKNLFAVLAAALQIDQKRAADLADLATRLRTIIGGSVKMSASSSETGTPMPPATP